MKVVVVARPEDGYASELARGIEAAGVPLVWVEPGDREALRRELHDAEALLCNRLEPGDTAGAARLRLVQALSAGADSVDPAALPPGCALCNLYGHEEAIAQWALLGMLAVSRQLLWYDRRLREGDWSSDLPLERELAGRVVGTIGYGHIGRRVAELARAFGMEAVAVTRSPSDSRAGGLRWLRGLDEVDALMNEADFVCVAVPLAAETRGLVGASELDALGPQGVLVNVARGDVVDERALFDALRGRRIGGAALDVWYQYPSRGDGPSLPSSLPFHELDNVVMTPHVSGRTVETRERRASFLVEQLRRLADGRELENVLAVGRQR
ncbi:MAG: 2-hydroxyacid dehydrogenase [Gaiellaceae bacterium]